MPELCLRLDGSQSDVDRVWATMLFPSQEDWHEWYCARLRVHDANDDEVICLKASTLKQFVFGPRGADVMKAVAEQTKRGRLAGRVLACLYVMDRFDIAEPSMNKAIYSVQHWAKQEKTHGDDSEIYASERKIREYWNEYRPVSHLWAALALNKEYPFVEERALKPENLSTFLEVAAGLLELGCEFVPKRAKASSPILDSEKCWTLPGVVPSNLVSDRIPDRLIEILKSYKAPYVKHSKPGRD